MSTGYETNPDHRHAETRAPGDMDFQVRGNQIFALPPGAIMSEDFQERGTSEQLAALYTALAKAQGSFGPIVKDRHVKITTKTGGTYEYDYAPLENIIDATRPALSANGIAVLQPPTRLLREGDKAVVRTVLSGHGARLVFVMEIRGEGDIKDFGGRITYARRYQLQAVLGVDAGEADDDLAPTRQNDASAESKPKNRQPPAPQRQAAPSRPQPAQDTPKPSKPSQRPQEAAPAVTPRSQGGPTAEEIRSGLNGGDAPTEPEPEPGPEPTVEPTDGGLDVPEDIRALDDSALAAEIRSAATALYRNTPSPREAAQKRCIEITGRPREELNGDRAALERLLMAFRADLAAAA